MADVSQPYPILKSSRLLYCAVPKGIGISPGVSGFHSSTQACLVYLSVNLLSAASVPPKQFEAFPESLLRPFSTLKASLVFFLPRAQRTCTHLTPAKEKAQGFQGGAGGCGDQAARIAGIYSGKLLRRARVVNLDFSIRAHYCVEPPEGPVLVHWTCASSPFERWGYPRASGHRSFCRTAIHVKTLHERTG